MRWYIILCLLSITDALALPKSRTKRDLTYLKNLFVSAIFGPRPISVPTSALVTHPKRIIYKTPSYGDIVQLKSNAIPEINVIKSYLGTNTREETNAAIQNINNLMTSGILDAESLGAIPEHRFEIIPDITNIQEMIYEVPALRDSRINVKGPLQTTHSYIQFKNNEPVNLFTDQNNLEMIKSKEIEVKRALPMCIKKRIQEVVLLAADPYHVPRKQTVYPLHYLQNFNIKYPGVRDIGRLPTLSVKAKSQHGGTNLTGTNMVTENSQPVSINHETSTSEAFSNNKIITDSDKSVNSILTVGLISPQYISHISYGELKVKSNDGISTPAGKVLNNQPVASNYTYQKIVQNSSEPSIVVKVGDQIGTDVKTNTLTNINSNAPVPNNFEDMLPVLKDVTALDNLHAQVQTTPIDSNIGPLIDPRKDKIIVKPNNGFGGPNVVPDDTYSYQQRNRDGTSMNISGGLNGVTVDIKDNLSLKNRGDIPGGLIK